MMGKIPGKNGFLRKSSMGYVASSNPLAMPFFPGMHQLIAGRKILAECIGKCNQLDAAIYLFLCSNSCRQRNTSYLSDNIVGTVNFLKS